MFKYVNIHTCLNMCICTVMQMFLSAKSFCRPNVFYTSYRFQALYVYACKKAEAKIISHTLWLLLLVRTVFAIITTMLYQIDNRLASISQYIELTPFSFFCSIGYII